MGLISNIREVVLLEELELRGTITKSQKEVFDIIDFATKTGRIHDKDVIRKRIAGRAWINGIFFKSGFDSVSEMSAADRLERDPAYREHMLWEYNDKILPWIGKYSLCRIAKKIIMERAYGKSVNKRTNR